MNLLLAAAFSALSTATFVTIPVPKYPCGWTTKGYVKAGTLVNFTVSVKQQNANRIEKTARAVSDPDSPRYGQYLSRKDIVAITAPKASDMEAVTSWLSSYNVEFKIVIHDVEVTCDIVTAERLLRTKFQLVSHKTTGQTRLHAGEWLQNVHPLQNLIYRSR